MPTVSIVLPTFNRAKFLLEAIESALAQTWDKIEVLVVDDGSSDETRDLVNALARGDQRVKYFYQENSGVSVARNHAIREATGDLIAFLDSDDIWKPWKLEIQVKLLKALSEVGMVWTNMDAIFPDGRLRQKNFLKTMYSAYARLGADSPFISSRRYQKYCPDCPSEFQDATTSVGMIYSKMFSGNLVHTPTVVLRRKWADQVGPFDVTMRRGGEDFKYHLSTSRLGDVAFIDVPSILYRVGNGDQITNRENYLHFAHSYLRTIQDELALHESESGLSEHERNLCLSQAHEWLSNELLNNDQTLQSLVHAIMSIYFKKSIGDSWKTITKCVVPQPLLRIARRCVPASQA